MLSDVPTYHEINGRILTRFRADPRTVRVAIRRMDDRTWRAIVTSLVKPGLVFTAFDHMPGRAVLRACRQAQRAAMPGVSMGLENAHEHPHRRAAA